MKKYWQSAGLYVLIFVIILAALAFSGKGLMQPAEEMKVYNYSDLINELDQDNVKTIEVTKSKEVSNYGTATAVLDDGTKMTVNVPSVDVLMEQVSQQMLPLKQKAERLLGSLDSVMLIVQGLFNEETKKNLSNSFGSIDRTLRNLEGASGNLDTLIQGESARISSILQDVNSITGNLRNNNEEISNILGNVSAISDSLRQASLHQTLMSLDYILATTDSIMNKINRGEGTIGALLNDNDLYYNLNQVSENLNRLLVEFRYNPKRFINLSLIDFSSGKNALEEYGVVIFESSERLDINSELYVQNPGLKEIKYKDKYLYIIDSYKKLKPAQRKLDDVIKRYNDAYIVKIDFV